MKRSTHDAAASFLPPKSPKAGLKSRRRRGWMQCGATVLMSFLVLIPLVLFSPMVATSTPTRGTPVDICTARGESYSFFEPDALLGRFTLGQAKLIDFGWNVVVGRGMQFLMVWGSYKIVLQGLTRIAETSPVDYDLFTALSFQPVAMSSAIPLAKGLFQLKGWRSKFTMVWLLFSLILVFVIPSLFDLATGYSSPPGLIYYSGATPNGTYYGPYEQLPRNFTTGDASRKASDFTCFLDASYRWGFVTGWIFIIFPLHSVWVFGMYVLWMDAQHNSKLVRSERKLGEWTALADLGHVMSQELGPHSGAYSSSEIGKVLRNGHRLKYDVQEDEDGFQHFRLVPQNLGSKPKKIALDEKQSYI